MHAPLSPSRPEYAQRVPATAEPFTPVDLRLPAQASELKRARDCVSSIAAEFGLDRKAAYELAFAVNEALTNAIKHGRPDADGTVGLHISADGDHLVCTVSDSGPFVPRTTPADPDNGESGRGFPFMAAFTDGVELQTDAPGTIVRLRKRVVDPSLVTDA